MSFHSFLQEKLGSHNPDEVEVLNLDSLLSNQRYITEEMKSTLEEEYIDLKQLSLNNIGLVCLKNLPYLPLLKSFEVRENLLSGDDLQLIVKAFPSIRKLKIGQNFIKKIEFFDCFSKGNLTILELYDNPLIDMDVRYKEVLFYKVKSLEIVDGIDRDGYNVNTFISDYDEDDDEDEEEGEGEGEGNEKVSNQSINSRSSHSQFKKEEEEDDIKNKLLLINNNDFNRKDSNSSINSLNCNDDNEDYRSNNESNDEN